MRSRAIEVWRQVYAHHNPLAQFFWVRFGKALKQSAQLVERKGYVRLADRANRTLPGEGRGRTFLRADDSPPRSSVRSQTVENDSQSYSE